MSSVKVRKIPSPSSPASPDENHAHIASETGEDNLGGEDTYPHQGAIPSPENGENRAQNRASEGSEGSEGISSTITEHKHSGNNGIIYRLGKSDTFACQNCRIRGDKWFMREHECKGKRRKS